MATSLASGRDDAAQPSDRNRAELAAVLASGIFKRSPKLSRLLLYLCEKSFQGLAGEITEYGIGLDVLGRDSGFDPQQDALVRVDTHHLRKRLKEFYATTGSEHEIHIILPNGQYAPQFVPAPPSLAAEQNHAKPTEAPWVEPPETISLENPGPTWVQPDRVQPAWVKRAWIVGMAALLVVGAFWLMPASRKRATRGIATPAVAASLGGGQAAEIRIAAGDRSSDYTDHLGRVWMSDRFVRGGSTFRRRAMQIQRTLDSELFLSGREGEFVYDIPLSPGTYELHLYFAETSVASESLHGVSVAINSLPVSSVDVASDAGGVATATVKIFKNISPAKDGVLHLTIMGSAPGFLNALEIVPGIPGKMRPVRLAARESVYRDHLGQIWAPDESSSGGRMSTTTARIEGTADPGLYQNYRVGHFSYSIPVVEGSHYTVRLYLVEPWFTQTGPAGGIGSRIFDVYCNGTTLLKNFDILKEAGGGKRAIIREFHGIPASPQGKLDLTFVPVVNYALINAIEIIEE